MLFSRLKTLMIVTMIMGTGLFADGKFLRGENWQRFTPEGKQADFYVAMNGNDNWSGTLAEPNAAKTDGPFATLKRAQTAVRELKQRVYKPKEASVEKRFIGSPHPFGEGKDILVYVREGYYPLNSPMQFTPEDGGERVQTNLPTGAFEYHQLKEHYVTWAAFPGEKAVITGGKPVGEWQKKQNHWVSRVDLAEVRTLVVNGATQPLARTPNSGYFTPAEHPTSTQAFQYRRGDVRAWPDLEGNRIIMLLRWHTGHNAISRIDEKKRTIHLSKEQDGIVVVPPRYYIENVKSLMDGPGEWFFDPSSSELSFIPPAGVKDPNTLHCMVPDLNQLVSVVGTREKPVRNLRFYGLGFTGAAPGSDAIFFEYAHYCELVDGRLSAMDGQAVRLGPGSFQVRVLGNHITNIQGSAITVAGHAHPEHWMDIVRENILSYNYIDGAGGHCIGALNCLNTTISHNEVTNNHGRTAIYLGNWSSLEESINAGYRLEYNHVHHVQALADDSGAITTAGFTHDSIIRNNLIHHVKAGYFNNNVAIWFDNMSLNWVARDNIMYALDQDEMKLCAANLVDNLYYDNHVIETPANEPEGILTGEPEFTYNDLRITSAVTGSAEEFYTGDYLRVTAAVTNRGATGFGAIDLYVDGKVEQSEKFPVIKNNTRTVEFKTRFAEPGEHHLAIAGTPYQRITVKGPRTIALYDSLHLSTDCLPAGEELEISVLVRNIEKQDGAVNVPLLINDQVAETQSIQLPAEGTARVRFKRKLQPGRYAIRAGQTPALPLTVYPHDPINIAAAELLEYCSATAKPCAFTVDRKKNHFVLQASGTDFMHGEDSYGTVYFKKPVKGNFVATVKLIAFGERTNPWFRAGLFVRNDLRKSFDTGNASLGSVLWFVTPGRVGMNWDRYGDGAMHWASSENHPKMEPYPMWLKLVRHGNRFSGFVSYDGVQWTISRQTEEIPGVAEAVHLGLAAGSCDEKSYKVEFEDFQVSVEKEGWK